jgi:hypothetical protein
MSEMPNYQSAVGTIPARSATKSAAPSAGTPEAAGQSYSKPDPSTPCPICGHVTRPGCAVIWHGWGLATCSNCRNSTAIGIPNEDAAVDEARIGSLSVVYDCLDGDGVIRIQELHGHGEWFVTQAEATELAPVIVAIASGRLYAEDGAECPDCEPDSATHCDCCGDAGRIARLGIRRRVADIVRMDDQPRRRTIDLEPLPRCERTPALPGVPA